MRTKKSRVLDLVERSVHVIPFPLGVVLLVLGVLYKTSIGSLVSVSMMFLGIMLVSFSILLKLGVFPTKLFSVAGLGTILICISITSLILAIVLFQFFDVAVLGYARERLGKYYKATCVVWKPSYLELCTFLVQSSFVLFIAGITIRLLSLVIPFSSIKKSVSNEQTNGI